MIKFTAFAAMVAVLALGHPSPTQSVEDNPFNNFTASVALDTTQVIKADAPELLCFDAPSEYDVLSCYEPGSVPSTMYDQYEIIWVGSKAAYAQYVTELMEGSNQ